MAYAKTGFNNWIDYDSTTDTIKYGSYEMRPELLGLTRQKDIIDFKGKTPKTMDELYQHLGATMQPSKATGNGMGGIAGLLYGNNKSMQFAKGDEWKNGMATSLAKALGISEPAPQQGSSLGTAFGGMGQSSYMGMGGMQNANGGMGGMGQMGGLVNKPSTTSSLSQNSDGTYTYSRNQAIPDTQAFAQSVSDKANELYNQSKNQSKAPQYSLLA